MVSLQQAMSHGTVPQAQHEVCVICLVPHYLHLLTDNPSIQLADERGASFPGTWLYGSCLVSLQCPAQASTGPELAHSKSL